MEEFEAEHDTTIKTRARSSGKGGYVMHGDNDWRWEAKPAITIMGPNVHGAFLRILQLVRSKGGNVDDIAPPRVMEIGTQTDKVSHRDAHDQAAGGLAPKRSKRTGGMAPKRGGGGASSSGAAAAAVPAAGGKASGAVPPGRKSGKQDLDIHLEPYAEKKPQGRAYMDGPRYPVPANMLELARRIQDSYPQHAELMKLLEYHVHHAPVLSDSELKLKVAFCVTTTGRTWQTKAALPHQVLCLWPYQAVCRLYIVEFTASQYDQDLQPWVEEHMAEAVHSGILQYYVCDKLKYWHSSVAKNAVHYKAADWADIVINLDTDFLFSPEVVSEVLKTYEKYDTTQLATPGIARFMDIYIYISQIPWYQGHADVLPALPLTSQICMDMMKTYCLRPCRMLI